MTARSVWTCVPVSYTHLEAAPVVRQIYSLCLAGNGPTKIARMLTEQQIPTPGTLEYRRTGSTRRYHPGYECKWATNTVVHILENREYTGCLVNFKTEKPSYKVKHSVENLSLIHIFRSPDHFAEYGGLATCTRNFMSPK